MQPGIRIEAAPRAPDDWDAFVSKASASAYHRASAVLVGGEIFGLSTTFVTARDASGAITGILPLVEQSSRLFGRFLVSLPFVTYGGVVASDAAVAAALVQRAAELARDRALGHVELRHAQSVDGLDDLPTRLDKVSLVLRLPPTQEALAKQLGAKLRSQIRRSERVQATVEWGGVELVPEFYRVYAQAMRDHGTPVYPRLFFSAVCDALRDVVALVVVRVGGTVHAGGVLVRHGAAIEVPWAAATPYGKRESLNMRMYWEMLRYSVERGAPAFDFGRSTVDSGTYRFKRQWGAEPQQLHWKYWLARGGQPPVLNQSNPKYSLAVAMWRRLPVPVANLLGPHIARHLP